MPVVGFKFTSVRAEKKGEPKGGINITSTPEIRDVRKVELPAVKDVVAMPFGFATRYEGLGEITFEGEVLFQGKSKDILKSWEKSKEIPKDVAVEVLNFIFRKCLSEAVHLSEIMQFPPPVRFPVVTAEKPDSKYVG